MWFLERTTRDADLFCMPSRQRSIPSSSANLKLFDRCRHHAITDQQRIQIFGGSDRVETQPIHFVDGKRPPMLLLTGGKDSIVLPRNTKNLAAKLRSYGSKVEEIVYPNVSHAGIMLALVPGFRRIAPVRADIIRFVEKN